MPGWAGPLVRTSALLWPMNMLLAPDVEAAEREAGPSERRLQRGHLQETSSVFAPLCVSLPVGRATLSLLAI